MKAKINTTLSALGIVIVTLAFSNCGNSQNGTHNMGTNRDYQPMQNRDMPARKSGTAPASASTGTHNMGDNKNYRPMANEDMPKR